MRSAQLHASARSGSLTLAFASPPELLAVAVGSGSATATVPRGTRYQVSAQRGSGSAYVQSGLSDHTAGQVIRAAVGSGTLAISYPG
jgi:hypothetical protein